MKLEFTLTQDDLLTHQLFATSKSKMVRKRRAQGKIFLLLIYMATGFFIWDRNGVVAAALFFVICMPLYFIYAYLEAKQYKKQVQIFTEDRFKDRHNQVTTLEFDDQQIKMTDGEQENIVPLHALEVIHEIGALYSLTLENGQGILIPKAQLASIPETTAMLQQLAEKLGIPYMEELNWKWK